MIEKLEWDSDFFGYPVGRINLTDEKDILLSDKIEAGNFRLVYIFSDTKLEMEDNNIIEVDIKTTFMKKIDANEDYTPHPSILEYAGGQDEALKVLALESGVYSRFKSDPQFKHNEFARLYTRWITDSINKKIADKLIVFIENDTIGGFISLKFREEYAEIGLVAVDADSRGKGIAMKLLNAAFDLTQKHGLPCIRIITQLGNVPAMKLYRKAGFEIEKKKHISHIWNHGGQYTDH